jgi:hypothetical protein
MSMKKKNHYDPEKLSRKVCLSAYYMYLKTYYQ